MHRRAATKDSATEVLTEEEQERIISDLVAQWAATEKWHRIALLILGLVLTALKFMSIDVPVVGNPLGLSPSLWDIISAIAFVVSLASLFGHRLIAIAALCLSVLLTLVWLPTISLSDYHTIITLLWFGGLNLLFAAAVFHFRLTAASSAKDLRRLAELQYPCKQA